MGQLLSILYIVYECVVNAVSYWRRSELQRRIEDVGLDEYKWTRTLCDISGVHDISQLEAIRGNGEEFQKLRELADDYEVSGLKELLGIPHVEEKPDTEAEVALCERLKESGLNDVYWFNILKTNFSVSNIESVRHLGLDYMNELLNVCRTRNDVVQFQMFIGTCNEFPSFLPHFGKVRNRIKIINECIDQIRLIMVEGKTRSSKSVQVKEQTMRETLQIPAAKWVRTNTLLQSMLTDLSKLNCCIEPGSTQIDPQELSPSGLIRSASCGICLKGILHLENGNDTLPANKPVLEVPSNCVVNLPHLPDTEKLFFGDEGKIVSFVEHTDKHGYVSGSVDIPIPSGNGINVWTVKMRQVPIASFTFRRDQLRFSDSALEHLKTIEALIKVNGTEARKRSKEFLNMYGSHVFQGPFHFGGIQWTTAQSTRDVGDVDVKAIQRESIAAAEAAPFGTISFNSEFNADKLNGNIKSKYTKHDLKRVTMTTRASGGPNIFSYFPTWKLGMSADISTWNVIDRNTAFPVAIWEILVQNYPSGTFENALRIGEYLYKAWTNMSNMHHMFSISPVLESLINKVHVSLTSTEHVDITDRHHLILEELIDIKRTVIKHTRSLRAWSDIFVGNQHFNIFNFLKRLMESPKRNTLSMICKIINDNDMLNQPCVSIEANDEYRMWRQRLEKQTQETSNGDHIIISEFNDFAVLLEQAIMDLEDRDQYSITHIKSCLSTAVLRLVDVFERQNRVSDVKFLDALTKPLGFDGTTGFLHTKTTIQDVSSIAIMLKQRVSAYAKLNDKVKKSVFIIRTWLKMRLLNGDDPTAKLQLHNSIKDLPREIRDQIDSLETKTNNWMEIEQVLCQYNGHGDDNYQDLKLENDLNNAIYQDKLMYGSATDMHNVKKSVLKCPDIINVLDLEKYFPKKLTRQEALVVSDNVISRQDLHDCSKIPWYMLQSIIMCNYDGRFFEFNPRSTDISDGEKLSALLDKRAASVISNTTTSAGNIKANPADALVALFMCADDFLRQIIMEKLAICQFSIPLLLPIVTDGSNTCEMLLWATRTIKKQWKTRQGSSYERSMTTHPIHTVSALRIGRPAISKSKIFNSVINDGKHDVFFHYGSVGGTVERNVSTGLLELTWYLPTGRDQDKFSDALAIMNLRGDALGLKGQTDFMNQVSSIIIVFITSDTVDSKEMALLESLYTQNDYLVLVAERPPGKHLTELLSSLERRYNTNAHKDIRLIYWSMKNELQVSHEIRNALNDMLAKGCCTRRSMQAFSEVARQIGFNVDEDAQMCLDAKTDAEHISECLQRYTREGGRTTGKHELLPLQTVAIKIAERKREQYQLKQKGNMETEKYVDKVQSELKDLRKEQKSNCKQFSKLIGIFMKSFSYLPLKRKYFHCWVKMFADQCSIDHLHPVREKYNAKWNKLCDIMSKKDDKLIQEIESMRKELDGLEKTLTNLSVGMEHIDREIGQIFEMTTHCNMQEDSVKQFPTVAADMLLEGHPLEIMDGDASHVPITWIKAVMSCLEDKIGKKRLFVLSVLGVQSTGKSTMLNVMFGLQFAVSAGRCTKGVFAQLVQLHPDLKQSTKCDYILVVDTEGLRAPELASIEHKNRDNEIATLVIGLGDATLINIMGENPTDMQDTLQIVVHALMKMETVKLKPSCLFVHQNVADVTASDKNTAQRRKMIAMLNDITTIAAKEENCSEKYRIFSDVIHFRENRDVNYISSLWQGDPPMAPPNPGYSLGINEVRTKIIDLMQNHDGQTISGFHQRLADLWNAILSENFVFSFRNTLEIQAFNALETAYVEHSRSLRRDAMTCTNILRTECNKLTHEVLQRDCEQIRKRNLATLSKHIETFQENMDNYFVAEPKAHQWKGKIQLRIVELCQNLRKAFNEALIVVKKKKNSRASIDRDIRRHEKTILRKAKDLADEFRCSGISEEKLKGKFDEHWLKWVSDIPDSENPVSVWVTLENVVRERFLSKSDKIVTRVLSKKTYKHSLTDSDINTVNRTFIDRLPIVGISNSTRVDAAHHLIQTIHSDALLTITRYKDDGKTFTEQTCRDIVEHVIKGLTNVNEDQTFTFTAKGLIRNTIKILWEIAPILIDLQDAYRKETDLKFYMETQKDRLWQMFSDACTIVEGTVAASCEISRELTDAITESLAQNCVTGVIDHIRTSRSRVFANKMSFHAQLLIDLADMDDFKRFRRYMSNPYSYMEDMIEETIVKMCSEETTEGQTVMQRVYLQKVFELFSKARTAIIDTRMFTSECSMGVWLPELLDNIGTELNLKEEELWFLNTNDQFDVNALIDSLLNELDTSKAQMQMEFNMKQILTRVTKPCKQFFKTDLLGCHRLCPFCKAPCDLQSSNESDDHRTEYHRPQGVAGYHKIQSRKLCVDVCTSSVMSDKRFTSKDTNDQYVYYKDYQSVNEYYKSWKIQPMPGESQLYWKWFMATYNQELAKYYGCKEADIPDGWREISWQSAKEDMINTYNL